LTNRDGPASVSNEWLKNIKRQKESVNFRGKEKQGKMAGKRKQKRAIKEEERKKGEEKRKEKLAKIRKNEEKMRKKVGLQVAVGIR